MAGKKTKDYIVDLEELLEAGVHFGHQSKRWHPAMSPFIWQSRGGVHIFDLLKTQEYLAKACEAVKDLVSQGKTIIFVGTKRQAQEIVKEEAIRCGALYIVNRWAGGLLTNWGQIKKSIDRLIELKEDQEKDKFRHRTKKERLLIDRKIAQLERLFGGVVELKGMPDALFVVDAKKEKTAVTEAKKKGVAVFGLIDSNTDPVLVDYPIPGNDDAVRSIKLLVSTFASAVEEGRQLAKKNN